LYVGGQYKYQKPINGEVESSYGGNGLQMLKLIFDDLINAF